MGHTAELDSFLNLHREQLLTSAIPKHYWPTINTKLQNQTFDAGQTFQLLKIDYDGGRELHEPVWSLQAIAPIEKTDPHHLYLIDHSWTFRLAQAKPQLLHSKELRTRLSTLLDIDSDALSIPQTVERIFERIWKVANTYSIGNAESAEARLPVWYIMDEIGCAVMHGSAPNARIVPFVHIPTQITYSLLFPLESIAENDFIYRDYAEGISDEPQRSAALLPWVPATFTCDIHPEPPGPEYYLSGHVEESLPERQPKRPEKRPKYKVYAEYELIGQYLTHERFEIVASEDEADILWYIGHFKEFKRLAEFENKLVNQFPFEYVLTVKDLFCLTCRRASKSWAPVTYNLQTEIGSFLSCFQQRQRLGLENYWIAKPFNLARSLDTHITDNLDYLMRLPATGPKIVQKYITNPVLFVRPQIGRVKFDIRYVLCLKSVKPLEAYVYRNFFLRFANQAFDLSEFHVYEKHFTVMNYGEDVPLKKMLCDEFKTKWEQLYPTHVWEGIEKKIFRMFREVLESACREEPPCGIAENVQSRALYAADLMLEWSDAKEIQPKILEVNWTPDCKRACEYYPEFYNDVFEVLFLDSMPESFRKI